jgi:hypothetical protein
VAAAMKKYPRSGARRGVDEFWIVETSLLEAYI